MRRVVKVYRSDLSIYQYVDVSKIVSISEQYNEYYYIYFDNAIWRCYADSYEEVMRAWLNPDKDFLPQDLTKFANTI